jgi:ribonuclease BN (tRNA processing enzyme)
MAGEYAKAVGARMLVLNHVSPRLQPDDAPVMAVVIEAATVAWAHPEARRAIAARDFLVVTVPKSDSGAVASVVGPVP